MSFIYEHPVVICFKYYKWKNYRYLVTEEDIILWNLRDQEMAPFITLFVVKGMIVLWHHYNINLQGGSYF